MISDRTRGKWRPIETEEFEKFARDYAFDIVTAPTFTVLENYLDYYLNARESKSALQGHIKYGDNSVVCESHVSARCCVHRVLTLLLCLRGRFAPRSQGAL